MRENGSDAGVEVFEDALGFATALLDGVRSRQQIDKLFEVEKPLPGAVPGRVQATPASVKSKAWSAP